MNLFMAQMMTYARRMALKAGEPDLFVAGENATEYDLKKAEETAQILEECIKKSEGNSRKFNKFLKKYMKED